MLSRIFENDYSLNLLNKVYSIFSGLLASIFLTRYLGLTFKGDFTYVTQIVMVLTIFLDLGIFQSYSYFYRKYSGDVLKQYINIYFMQFITYSIIALFLYFLLYEQVYLYILILLPSSILKQQISTTVFVENVRLGIKVQMVNSTIKMVAFGFLFLFVKTTLLFPVLITLGLNIFSIVTYLYFMNIIPKPNISDLKFAHEAFNYGWLPMITALLITFNYTVDIFLLKHMGSAAELGLYSTAVGIVNYFWLIPDSFKEVLISRVARSQSIASTLLAIKISLITMIVIIIAFLTLGQTFINMLYGLEFSESYLVTLILTIGAISMIFFKMIGVVFLAEGKRWFYFFSLLTSVITNIVTNIVVIPLYGMYGAALATVISYSICGLSFLSYFIYDKKLKISEVILLKPSEVRQLKNMFVRR